MKRTGLCLLFLCTVSLAISCGWGEVAEVNTNDEAPALDVMYGPTPPEVVTRMLQMAEVGPHDLVYDLGAGDGRIVIAAAQQFGARAVGIDLDPKRITEANANAQHAGVSGRVRFIQYDLFKADISEATVVTLFLSPSVNVRLRPKLWRDLKPGTRVVSHLHDMGDWKPEKVEQVNGRTVYYWVISSEAAARVAEEERAAAASTARSGQK